MYNYENTISKINTKQLNAERDLNESLILLKADNNNITQKYTEQKENNKILEEKIVNYKNKYFEYQGDIDKQNTDLNTKIKMLEEV
jgi:hypothetical protein